jgi:hypothetical protein
VKTLSYVVILLLSFAVPVRAAVVYSGCAVPPTTPRHVWYIDPVHGKTPAAGGNGSQAAPWNSLKGVIQGTPVVAGYARPLLSTVPYYHVTAAGNVDVADTLGNPPVGPGDTIMLMSGAYGDIAIGEFSKQVVNSDFVTVQAAPGQTPVFTTLYIRSANKWIFNGIKVQSLKGTNGNDLSLIEILDQGAALPTSDIILRNMAVSSMDSIAGLTQAQIRTQFRGYAIHAAGGNNGADTTCVSVTNSHMFNMVFGAYIGANNMLFANNEVDHDGDDMADYAASNILLSHNYLHDDLNIGNGAHMDGFQGYPGRPVAPATFVTFKNVTIDSNLIIRQTDPNLPFPTYLQGIDAFDGDWTNVTVTNNVIVTSACWGIALGSLHNSLVASNTVLEDGLVSTPGCSAALDVGGKTHEGPDSTNVRVTNNLAEHFDFPSDMPVSSWDHNVALNWYQPFVYYENGGVVYAVTPGTDANGNVAPAKPGFPYASQFVTWSPSTLSFNLMLLPGSVAIGAGTNVGVPTIDILGVARAAPYAVGAYSYPY